MLIRTKVTKGQTYGRKKEVSRVAAEDDEVKKSWKNLLILHPPKIIFILKILII